MMEVDSLRRTADEMLSGVTAGEDMKRRIRFSARGVEALPEVAGEMLAGIEKTPALRHRILLEYDRRRRSMRRMEPARVARLTFGRLAPALSMALAFVMLLGVGIFGGSSQPAALPGTGISSYASGSMSADGVPEFMSLFAGEDANPPLLCINGRYYRMMSEQTAVPAALLNSPLAEVQSYSAGSALTNPAGIASNTVAAGTQIYSITGLSSKTAVAAEVDGVTRLFQRVSYAGSSTLGNEMFQDTMDVVGQVAALELSGVGVVTDESAANEVLMYMLTEFASFTGADTDLGEAQQSLTIYLSNGLALQLMVDGDVFSACGSWSCEGFTDTFRAEMAK